MSVAAAIQNNAQAVTASQNAYQSSFYFVNQQMVSVTSSDLPVLNTEPSSWSQILSTNTAAKAAALDWFNAVTAPLSANPQAIEGYNSTISLLLSLAAQEASTLEQNPSDSATLSSLKDNLTNVSQLFNLVNTFVNGALNSLTAFDNTQFPTITANLQTLINDYAQEVQADQNQITTLNNDITTLKADIQNQIQNIVDLLIVAGGAIAVTRLAPGWTPTSCLVKFLAGVTLACATYNLILDAEKIATDAANIKNDESQINSVTADVGACQLYVTQLQSLSTQMATVQQDLTTLSQAWQVLSADITAAIEDITAAVNQADGGTPNFSAIAADIAEATNQWNALYNATAPLVLNITVNTAQLSPGMTQSQIQTATSAAQNISLIEFVNGAYSQ